MKKKLQCLKIYCLCQDLIISTEGLNFPIRSAKSPLNKVLQKVQGKLNQKMFIFSIKILKFLHKKKSSKSLWEMHVVEKSMHAFEKAFCHKCVEVPLYIYE